MIRLYVEAPLAAGVGRSRRPRARRIISASSCAAPSAMPCSCSTAATASGPAASPALSRGKATFAVETLLRPQAHDADLWLVFALLKRDATDLVVQKATELGVSALLPVFTERTNAGRVNLDRLRAIAIEAAEQSERLTVPASAPPGTA